MLKGTNDFCCNSNKYNSGDKAVSTFFHQSEVFDCLGNKMLCALKKEK